MYGRRCSNSARVLYMTSLQVCKTSAESNVYADPITPHFIGRTPRDQTSLSADEISSNTVRLSSIGIISACAR